MVSADMDLSMLRGSLLGELILLGVIYGTQMFWVSSYPVRGVCVWCVNAISLIQSCFRLSAQEILRVQ